MPMIMGISSTITLIFVHLCCLTLLTFHFSNCNGSSEILCVPSEREALLKVKHHLNDSSHRLASWNAANTNCCQWEGVVCSNVTGHILELRLSTSPPSDHNYDVDDPDYEAYYRSRLGGEINPSLLDLKHLKWLDLSGNDFEGTQIPSFLGAMTSLTHLNLSRAGFYGKIPHQIGNLTNLLHLDLSLDYDLYEQSTSVQWLSGLSSLQYLDLSTVNLSKSFDWLQTMQSLPSLVELRLSGCFDNFYYNHPSTVNFSSLVTLDLSDNNRLETFFFPKWIFGLKKLVSLQFSRNYIQSPIPDGIRNLTLLENLDLFDGMFSSSIPDWLYGLHHLKFLNLRDNNLRGAISGDLGNLTSLVSLDLSFNQLEGTIPTSLGNLTSLVSLDLSGNQLEGMIPTSLGKLCNLTEISLSRLPKFNQQVSDILEILTPCISHGLKRLQISGSQLSGNLTDKIGIFKNLVRLDFYNNSIRGALPRSLGILQSLRYLDLSSNHFIGNPFESLKSLSELSILYIEDNLFAGVVKEADLANLTSIKTFSASRNNLTLKVGPNWSPNFKAIELDMGSWHLGPNFPSWISSQKHLQYLDMSDTRISDSIPTWFWATCSPASEFNLSHNRIHGELTNALKTPISFRMMDLSSNHLSGQLPRLSTEVIYLDLSNNSFSEVMNDFLCQKQDEPKRLEYLNLASNNLSGEIPDCWVMWRYLMDIRLQSNYFTGNLPPSMGSLAQLESLSIRNNMLSGKFPPILKNTTQLISLDLGENKLTGIIPARIGERLLHLKILRLRSNKFLGHIPNQICAMNNLQILDLAQNSLSGNIPNCFNHFSRMIIKNGSTDSLIFVSSRNISRESIISVHLWLKGRDFEYSNNLGLVTSIDLSDNKLSGEIPKEITDLSGLIFLNLSHNQLTGHIPQSIGNMRLLESIDFSRNQLSGEIPSTISNLSFLNELDLSYNHLKGKIPIGTQLQSFEASNFFGNSLCGPPLTNNCSPYKKIPDANQSDGESDGHKVNWFFVSMAFGFVVGFWVVVAPLFIYRSWRYAYFHFLDDMWYKLQSCW